MNAASSVALYLVVDGELNIQPSIEYCWDLEEDDVPFCHPSF
ncbi:hypothetical protein [Candidatus Enterovibrio altilux]|uniref:Uncharacterized protein n=1 Tax=Candidatus Enterovibrio altilux TaxID=1927128 RepID=A0A291B732_9GAMM|nr:hypothetical protein [Candidatus Enterovibrio luxaltus]ATF08793.1 hypothetical protein BTN50_0255 [Candidatus Enterovibrio luxaltus]